MTLQKFLTFCFCLFVLTASAQDSRTYKRLADKYYASEKYQEALDAYQRYMRTKPNDLEVIQNVGICHYFTNNLNEAYRLLSVVIDKVKRPEPDVYFFLGRTLHAQNKFKEAAAQYKSFLKQIDEKSINRPLVKDAIRRCANGLRLSGKKAPVIVENMGEKVNSRGDDFRPILSRNHSDKLYFSSVRAGNLGGLRDENGIEDKELGQYCSDMYSTTIINGEWTGTQLLSYLLNSPRHDILLDFSERGDKMYFSKGYTQFSGQILVDTFKQIEEKTLYAGKFDGPIEAEKGDCAPHFYNDSILLFASRRPGGFGGLDLYISKKKGEEWAKPENLGKEINSAYDENTPFLAKDGRTLYFSSNRADRSIGGYDVFEAKFIDRKQEWNEPINLLTPINSSGDDKDFRLAQDGYKAFFSSSRKEGFGKNDLYVAYFKDYRKEATNSNQPITFLEVLEQKRIQESFASGNNSELISQVGEDVVIFKNEALFYETNGDAMTIGNVNKLKKIAKIANEYPELNFLFTAHSDGSDPAEFDLYFTIKRAEKVAEYLLQQGIDASRVTIASYGSAFPIAKNEVNGIENIIGKRLNRRIDVTITNTENLPLIIDDVEPEIRKEMKTLNSKILKNGIKGLSYKVQIAAIKQMYKGDLIKKYPYAMIERQETDKTYRYTIGRYNKFNSANQLKNELINQGAVDAFVVPYIDGIRLNTSKIMYYTDQYPDLAKYLTLQNKDE